MKNVREGKKRVPYAFSCLLGEMFKECGVDVRYAVEKECDDTIMSWAVKEGAAVLSSDKGYGRYKDGFGKRVEVEVFRDFQLQGNGTMKLIKPEVAKMEAVDEKEIQWTELPSELPGTATDYAESTILDLVARGQFRRGPPTALLRKLSGEHPHLVSRPLRQAYYYRVLGPRVGKTAVISERFPIWDTALQQARYLDLQARPDPALESLLDRPAEAVEFLFRPTELLAQGPPKGIDLLAWHNHIYSLHAVTFEIVGMATGRPMLELFRENCDLSSWYSNGFTSAKTVVRAPTPSHAREGRVDLLAKLDRLLTSDVSGG